MISWVNALGIISCSELNRSTDRSAAMLVLLTVVFPTCETLQHHESDAADVAVLGNLLHGISY